ncbi:MAG: helix-turn-helix transcriptional regulator [Clostridia bacterium]|nr:helix-turn-helix transcriptional regulator [Clostridia bacterium]
MSGDKHAHELLHIGERIRDERIRRGMTQFQLAGEDMTRNMLSRIENGAALPSLPTLCMLASRLGIPAGSLLGDLEDYHGFRLCTKLKRLLEQRRYLELLEEYDKSGMNEAAGMEASDGELHAILCEAKVGRAGELYREGRLTDAASMLDEADAHAKSAALPLTAVRQRAAMLRTLIDSSPTHVEQPPHDPAELREIIFGQNELAIYLWARDMLSGVTDSATALPDERAKDWRRQLEPLLEGIGDSPARTHIEARLDIADADYLGAKARLMTLTADADRLPPTLLYELYTDLEFCCKCCGDFENAYKYASMKLEILKRIK